MHYMIERCSTEESENSKQITVVKREEYGVDNEHSLPPGVYTEKEIHIRQFLPGFLRFLIPKEGLTVIEKSWNAYPERCITLYESPWLGKAFYMSVESRYLDNDRGDTANALELPDYELENRQVVTLDIASDDDGVANFESAVTKRPRLGSGGVWIRQHEPIMCAYKVVRMSVDSAVLPNRRIEQWTHNCGLQHSFLNYNRKVLRWIDSWFLNVRNRDVQTFAAPPGTHAPNQNAVAAVKTVLCSEIARVREYNLVFAEADATNPFV